MAENIGKIVVSIEAEVAELRKGLASAEAEFKKSADKLAAIETIQQVQKIVDRTCQQDFGCFNCFEHCNKVSEGDVCCTRCLQRGVGGR